MITETADAGDIIEPMSSAELRVVREHLGLTGEWLATQLGVQDRTWRRWEAGTQPVPEFVREYVERVEVATAEVVGQYVAALRDATDVGILTYRRDEGLWAERADMEPYPASWHRAVCARVAQEVPGLEIVYDE